MIGLAVDVTGSVSLPSITDDILFSCDASSTGQGFHPYTGFDFVYSCACTVTTAFCALPVSTNPLFLDCFNHCRPVVFSSTGRTERLSVVPRWCAL